MAHGRSSAGVHDWLEAPPGQMSPEPNVMLSPKASTLVLSRRGGAVTVTLNEHEGRWFDTNAEHETAVVPTEKSDPLAGVQLAVTGGCVERVGGWKLTATGLPSEEPTVIAAGQVSVGVGPDGVSPHAAANTDRNTTKIVVTPRISDEMRFGLFKTDADLTAETAIVGRGRIDL